MALIKKGAYWYGTSPQDIQAEIRRYSALNGYEVVKFFESVCDACGHRAFKLETDEDEGVARRTCTACGKTQLMGDSAEYVAHASFESHACVCDEENFELSSGVALYGRSNEVRWFYIGGMCTKCDLVGVLADWKCEAGDADVFLAQT